MTSRRALIPGVSIAGPVLAFWLAEAGWDVTVVERAENRRITVRVFALAAVPAMMLARERPARRDLRPGRTTQSAAEFPRAAAFKASK